MAFVIKEIQATPNPNAMKYVLDRIISAEPTSFYSVDQAKGHALGAKLMAVAGVSNIMLLGDFVTVGRQSSARWSDINSAVRKILSAEP